MRPLSCPLSHLSVPLARRTEPNKTEPYQRDTAGPSQAYFNDDTRLEIITAITTTHCSGRARGEGEEEVGAGGAEHMALPHFVQS